MRRILLVDDEINVLTALRRALRARLARDIHVESLQDPVVAKHRIGEVAFDVIISDYRMPVMNGIELLTYAKKMQPLAARLILSASTDFHTIQQAVNSVEVFRYLAKPWLDDEFAEAVCSALERSQSTAQERELADAMRVQQGNLTAVEMERQRLERLEPGITAVEWGPNGEIIMPVDELDVTALPGDAKE